MPTNPSVDPVVYTTAIPPQLLALSVVARMLGVARSTVYELIAAGELRTITIGRRRLVLDTEVQRFVATRVEVAKTQGLGA